ncbi:uncharacterized protein LOC126368050 [Pectinophora gossypiella]|uniref:uncharacterized protein LOC126368050 n=1 Tax=Pectinophora gossypiella TaxID=13191 RepID=UPI00214E1ECC|nr:uncharacterized protein LOC126368050 [Pectinophora gossypiella]
MAVTRFTLLFCLFFVCSKSEETNSTEVELSKKADGAPTSVDSRFFDLGGIINQLFPGFNQGNQGGPGGNPAGMDFPANSQFYPTFPIQGQNPQVPMGQTPQMPIGQGTWPVIDDAKQYPNLAQTGPQQPQFNNPGNFGGFPQPQYPSQVNGGGSPQMQYPPNQGGFGSQYPNLGSLYPGYIGQPMQNGQFPNQGGMNQFPQNQNQGNMFTQPIYPDPGNLGNTGPQTFPPPPDQNNGGTLQNQFPNNGGLLNQMPNNRPGQGSDGSLDSMVPPTPQDPWNSNMPNNFSLLPQMPGAQQPGGIPPGNIAILGNPVVVPPSTTEAGLIFYPSSTESAAKKQCVQDCQTTTEYNPVCGSDNVTYINPGKFVCARNCGVDVFVMRKGKCPNDAPYPRNLPNKSNG